MTTAEKRAELAARGEPWPECPCHGEPMFWQIEGRFRCAVKQRAWREQKRAEHRGQGVCVWCGRPAVTSLCQNHADRHLEAVTRHADTPRGVMARRATVARKRLRQRAREGFQPTTVGQAAIAAAMAKRAQPSGR